MTMDGLDAVTRGLFEENQHKHAFYGNGLCKVRMTQFQSECFDDMTSFHGVPLLALRSARHSIEVVAQH